MPGAEACRVEPAGLDEVRRYGPGLHDQFRRTQAGALDRDQVSWRLRTGELRNPAGLAMDVSALGTLYLGDQTVYRLAAAGLVAEQRPGALSRAGHMLRTPSRPWCPDGF